MFHLGQLIIQTVIVESTNQTNVGHSLFVKYALLTSNLSITSTF